MNWVLWGETSKRGKAMSVRKVERPRPAVTLASFPTSTPSSQMQQAMLTSKMILSADLRNWTTTSRTSSSLSGNFRNRASRSGEKKVKIVVDHDSVLSESSTAGTESSTAGTTGLPMPSHSETCEGGFRDYDLDPPSGVMTDAGGML